MGQYLYVNIATKIVVEKTNSRGLAFSCDDIVQRIDQNFNSQLYDIEEDDSYVYFFLKDHMTKQYLYSFLKEHLAYLPHKDYLHNIEKIKHKTTQEVIHYLQNEDIDYIYFNDYDNLRYTYLDQDLKIYLEGIFYLSEGKILIEETYHLSKYFHQRLRAPHHNPLEESTYLSII